MSAIRSYGYSATLLLASVASLSAQTSSFLEGTVYDPSRAGVFAAMVRIVQAGTNAARVVPTDRRGNYLAPGLPPGEYRIEVSKAGFRSEARDGLRLAAGAGARVDFQLSIGEVRERVEVVAEAPLLSTSAGAWGAAAGDQDLESLPLDGRDLFDLASQQAGAVVASTDNKEMVSGWGIHVAVNGLRPNQNNFRLDGIYVNDAASAAPTSAARRSLGLEAIQEMRLVSSPFSAEYGRAAGGVFTAVSKSGTNRWHGSLYEYLRNSALDARNYFDPADEPIPPLRRNHFGGLLSGPVRPNRVFAMLNYEGLRETRSRTVRPLTLTAEAREGRLPGGRTVAVAPQAKPYIALYPLPNGRDFGDGAAEYVRESPTLFREDYSTAKLDMLASETLRFSARYTLDDSRRNSGDPFGIWSFPALSRHQFLHTDTQWIPTPAAIHNFRAGFSRARTEEQSVAPESFPPSLAFIAGRRMGSIQVVGLTDLGGADERLRPRRYATNDYQLNHDATHIRGGHVLKFGGGYDRVQLNQVADYNPNGYYRFTSIASFLQGLPQAADLMAPGSDSARGWRQHLAAAYFQDEYRAGRRLSVSLGLRYETYSTPSEVNGKVAVLRDPERDPAATVGGPLFLNPSRRNFAPRASLAWDAAGGGRTVFRAGAGAFFDLIGVRETLVAGVRMPPFFTRLSPVNPVFPDLLAAARNTTTLASPDGLEYSPSQPYVLQFQAAIERRIGADGLVRIGYAGSRGIHLLGQLGNVNPARPEVLADGRIFFPENAPRVNPAFAQIGVRRAQFNSFAHALHVSLERRLRGGLRFQSRYSWAKAIDESSNGVFLDFLNADRVPTLYNYRQNRGRADFDVRHLCTANVSWRLPQPSGRVARIAGGWELHAMAEVRTGPPFNPRVGFDRARLRPATGDLDQRPDFVAAPGRNLITGDPAMYFEPLAFAVPAAGFYGNLGRNTLAGPGAAVVDLGLHKSLWQSEWRSLRLRAEVFNVANHPNFQIPSGLTLFNSNLQRVASAGRITETSTASRQIQLALRYEF